MERNGAWKAKGGWVGPGGPCMHLVISLGVLRRKASKAVLVCQPPFISGPEGGQGRLPKAAGPWAVETGRTLQAER